MNLIFNELVPDKIYYSYIFYVLYYINVTIVTALYYILFYFIVSFCHCYYHFHFTISLLSFINRVIVILVILLKRKFCRARVTTFKWKTAIRTYLYMFKPDILENERVFLTWRNFIFHTFKSFNLHSTSLHLYHGTLDTLYIEFYGDHKCQSISLFGGCYRAVRVNKQLVTWTR